MDLDLWLKLSKDNVLDILKVSKQTIDKFNEKFDWSANNFNYSSSTPAAGMLPIDDTSNEKVNNKVTEEKAIEAGVQTDKTFNFDGISF